MNKGMKFLFLKKIFKRAFSLIELSIVIVIISILLSGVLSIATSTTNSAKIKTTNNNIDEIYKALKVYLLANNRLPCPAPITAIKASSTTYGESAGIHGTCSASGIYTSTTETNIVYGMVPVKDLGLSIDMAEDGYGSKLAYIVDKRFTNDYSSATNFGSDNGSVIIKIYEVTSAEVGGSEVSQVNTEGAIFAIISYGANKSGAFGVNSATQNTASDDGKETFNYAVPEDDTTAIIGNIFYSRAGSSDVFDDMVFYKTRNMMVTESNALNIIPCPALAGTSSGVSYDGTYMTWGEGKYGQVVTANSSCPSGYQETVAAPTKRCNAFGQWQSGVVDPCTYTATAAASSLSCTGGTPTTSGGNNIHTFTSNGSLVCTGSGALTYLVVGGGGGGGGVIANSGKKDLEYGGGGGGGGGGVKSGTYNANAETFTVTVGSNGSGGSAASGSSGTSSSVTGGALSASGTGGSGGHYGGNQDGVGGNSGVGNSTPAKSGGASQTASHGAGGGGASMAGAGGAGGLNGSGIPEDHGDHRGGAGATGTSNSITGSAVVYGSGGGGGAGGANSEGIQGVAGSGAGAGAKASINAGNGTANRGSGGGGGAKSATSGNGSAGVVIFSYTTP